MKRILSISLVVGWLASAGAVWADAISLRLAEGDVTIARAGADSMTPAEAGMALNAGDEVHTGFDSRAQVAFGASSVVNVESLTQFRIRQHAEDNGQALTRLQVRIGEIRAEVDTDAVRSDFGVDTPNSTAAVEGTTPRIKSDPMGDRHSAASGRYIVQSARDHRRWFAMTAGRQGKVKPDGEVRDHRLLKLIESQGGIEPMKGITGGEEAAGRKYRGRRNNPWLIPPHKAGPGNPTAQKNQQDSIQQATDARPAPTTAPPVCDSHCGNGNGNGNGNGQGTGNGG